MVRDFQSVLLCNRFESFVVVAVPTAAGVLDIVLSGVQVAHLVQKCGAGFFNGAVQRRAVEVDFIAAGVPGLPNLVTGKMSIRTNGLLRLMTTSGSSLPKKCAFSALNIFSSWPATREVLTVCFILTSSKK